MKPKTVGRAQVSQQAQSTPRTRNTSTVFDIQLSAETLVMTPNGPQEARTLAAGDRIITRDSGTIRIDGTSMTASLTRAVSFSAASCGSDRDLVLPASQPVLLRDWRALAFANHKPAAVAALKLVDEEFVIDLGHRALDLVHLHFSHPQVIYAGGIELAVHQGRRDTPETTLLSQA